MQHGGLEAKPSIRVIPLMRCFEETSKVDLIGLNRGYRLRTVQRGCRLLILPLRVLPGSRP